MKDQPPWDTVHQLHRHRPAFQEDTSNVYHIIPGTTSTGASRILAEELIRPGDFPMHHDPLQSGFPAYGHCSAGQKVEETTQLSHNLKQLTKKILKTSQGSMSAFICGIHSGRHSHPKHSVSSNDEAQFLCGKYGIARGQNNYMVARSEHTTVCGVILTYQNNLDAHAPADRSTSPRSVKSSSNLSWNHLRRDLEEVMKDALCIISTLLTSYTPCFGVWNVWNYDLDSWLLWGVGAVVRACCFAFDVSVADMVF